MKVITLPKHEHGLVSTKCHCGGDRVPVRDRKIFAYKNNSFYVYGIKSHICVDCGECVYSSSEAKLIEDALREAVEELREGE
jgi:hypothetical protein